MSDTESRQGRPLTAAERALARGMFGAAIDLDPVRVFRRKWFPFQPRNVTMAPRGHLHFHPASDAYQPCFAGAGLGLQAHFIHEMVHVWQHQRGLNLVLRRHPFCRYHYAVRPGWTLERYGIEQQAEIVRHVFLLRRGAIVPGAPPLASLETILPFGTASAPPAA
ncbi:vgr related protein [Sphingomonas azotifigens]|uniref:vgr related protein n=1 Tax=Sphingomonas azotifigens TaxID=330920 RepID=UPI0009FCDC67|nr:vgr related protein [Sphingomonas azotifigens]